MLGGEAMSSVEQARTLALALPGAVERDHHGRPSFRVDGRIFATLWDGEHLNVMVRRSSGVEYFDGEVGA